jgi:3-oxoacyl-[acyl-carrier protein] reductase
MLLPDRVAVVTGAAQGIGLSIAERFLTEGAVVVIADLNEATARHAASQLSALGKVEGLACDVTDEAAVDRLFDDVIARQGYVDVLVNNAGITRDRMIHRMPLEAFRQVVDVHLQGSWLATRAAMRHMREREGGGSIINISSIAGKIGNLGQTNYAAAKAGLVGLTKAAAREGGRFGIRVNAVQPGLIRTAMTEALSPEAWKEKLADIPLGRAGEPREVADVCLFLASDLSRYVTGAVIEVTGGRGM